MFTHQAAIFDQCMFESPLTRSAERLAKINVIPLALTRSEIPRIDGGALVHLDAAVNNQLPSNNSIITRTTEFDQIRRILFSYLLPSDVGNVSEERFLATLFAPAEFELEFYAGPDIQKPRSDLFMSIYRMVRGTIHKSLDQRPMAHEALRRLAPSLKQLIAEEAAVGPYLNFTREVLSVSPEVDDAIVVTLFPILFTARQEGDVVYLTRPALFGLLPPLLPTSFFSRSSLNGRFGGIFSGEDTKLSDWADAQVRIVGEARRETQNLIGFLSGYDAGPTP